MELQFLVLQRRGKLNLHFRPELSPAKLKGAAEWTQRQMPHTATTTCSSAMQTIPNPSQITPGATTQAVAQRALQDTRLNCSDLRIAQYLLNSLPANSSAVTIENRALSKAIGRSVRTVQDAFVRLSRAGLIHRTQLNADAQFSLRETTLNITAVRKALAANKATLSSASKRRRAKKKKLVAPAAIRFPFHYLKEPRRFEAAHASLADELQAGHAYWQMLSKHASSPSAPLRVKVSSQRRKISDGDRGAPMWGQQMRADDLAAIDAYVLLHAAAGEEVAFQVVSADHRLLLIDDVPKHLLDALPAQAIVLETSPETYQVTLIAHRALNKDERKAAQRTLVWQFQGDPGAMASNQLRRLPASLNNKPKLQEAFVTRIVKLPNDLNAVLSANETDWLIEEGQRSVGSRKQVKSNADAAAPTVTTNATSDEKAPDNSESVQEFRWAREQLRRGADKAKLRVQLAHKAHARGKRSTFAEALEYADMTLFNVSKYWPQGFASRNSGRPSAA